MREEVFILGAARTPIGKFLGGLASVPAPQLAAVAIRAALDRAGIDPARVEEVIVGNVLSAGIGQAPARQAALAAGIPDTASALTVNKVCASGLAAVVTAAQQVQSGDVDLAVAGGMESMSQAPHIIPRFRDGIRYGNAELVDSIRHDGLTCPTEHWLMGNAAEAIARKYGISREEQDAFAYESHRKAILAMKAGALRDEIATVELKRRQAVMTVDLDEGPRSDTTVEALAKLSPAFEPGGTVTAGNAPGLADGAAALVVSSAQAVTEHHLRPLARITGYANANLAPRWLFDAPVMAVRRLLERTGRSFDDFDLIELNEAFAAQALANGRQLGWDWNRVNVNGGAIALGHPIGASGARIVVTLLYALRQRGGRQGLAVLCHGGGGAVALSVELV